MEPSLNNSEREMLAECQGEINDLEYTPAQRTILKNLQRQKLVALRWVITPEGRRAAGLDPYQKD